ncbi:hypothetical protein HYH02_012834 [Chlamydomonas schloesseri]|uniref:J domain-containing protein n=1 Tax=Chlamydomonas schloesseri TaxID=2026947 RepID=A0A835SU42_9CHLO|nr:hypothetical protein HYH02_012834 [Chlamydomonas schloesseri]|eukprot:KAG2433133.1 hypothetical protein HYH02_012834 [Chlamydomonas schloesseri]
MLLGPPGAPSGPSAAQALQLLAAALTSRGSGAILSQSLAWGGNCRQAGLSPGWHAANAAAACAPPYLFRAPGVTLTNSRSAPTAAPPGGLPPLLAWARAALAPHGARAYATTSGSSSSSSSSSSSNSSSGSGSSSSSSNSNNNSGGSNELLANKSRVLQFSLDRGEAERQWEAHHAGLLSSDPGGWDSCKATLLPWWCFSAQAITHVSSAQVGRNVLRSRYNPATRRNESFYDTEWWTVQPHWRYSRRWGVESPEAQVYGGSKYRHDPALDRMRPGEYVRRAVPYSDYLRGKASGASGGDATASSPDRLVPYRMGPIQAAEEVKQSIRNAELRSAEEQLRSTYGADQVRHVMLDLELEGLSATPVFVPVYVFKTRVRGTVMRTYVAGFAPGLSSGPVLPNPTRVAALTAAAAPVALAGVGVFDWLPLPVALVFSMVLPALVGYLAASFWPQLYAGFLLLRQRLASPLPEASAAEQEAWWRYEWVRQDADEGYGYSSDARYSYSYSQRERERQQREQQSAGSQQRQQQYQQQYQQYQQRQQQQQQSQGRSTSSSSSSSGGGGGSPHPAWDPRGLYAALGVSRAASKEEVQAAFRAAAMRVHPDRQPDPKLKAEATRRFQAVQEAYSVLRDPQRRAAYDRGGYV